MSFEVNQHVGDYEIIGVLGAGGMGKVYKVRNVISDRIEAMKVLLPDLATEPELAERFTSEIKVLAAFNHPNIAALHTALRIDNQLVMIMEFVEGITLEARLRQGPIPLPDCLNYVSQVLDALSYAHEQGVIHRDVKPANMMLTPGGVLKLMDFGIAKSTDAQKMTVTGATLGSLYYMSPEQVKGIHLDTRSDLYSMGVSIYELVTGKRPFQGDSNYAIMAAHLQSVPRPPIELDPKLPKALNEIILTCLSKEPAHRFGSAKALRTAIESVRASLGPPSAAVAQPQAMAGVPRAAVPVGATGATAVLSGASTAPLPSAQAAAPMSSAAAPASAAPAAASRGYRGFYMALGALVAVVIIVLAAMELPRWLKTRAGAKSPVQVTQPATSTPSNPSSPAAASSSAAPSAEPGVAPASAPPAASPAAGNPAPPAHDDGRPSSSPAATSAAEAAAAATGPIAKRRPAVHRPAHAAEKTPEAASPSAASASAGQSAVGADTGAASSSAATPRPSAESTQELNDRMTQLTARANAVKDSLDNLRRQQNASGLSLRGDVSASLSRMEQYMDAADRALAAGNSESAGKSMDRAEHEIEGLEKFLGR